MELTNDRNALIDKVTIYDFTVTEIDDIAKLQRSGNLVVKDGSDYYIYTESGKKYSTISITADDNIDEFTFSIGINGDVYGCMSLSVPDDGYHNLNCLTAKQYLDIICNAQLRLISEYGIYTDFSNAKYKRIEINKTIVINGDFAEYQRPLTLMMFLLPGKLRLKGECDYSTKDKSNRQKATDYKRSIMTYHKTSGERGLTIKIYDKRKQLQEEYDIKVNHNYLRYEITLNAPAKIRQCLETNEVFFLEDEAIQNFFGEFINDNILIPYRENKKKREVALTKILKSNYKAADRKWVERVLLEISNYELENRGIPLMLDVNELIPLLGKLKLSSRQNKSHYKNRFLQDTEKYSPAFTRRDDIKYLELIEKLL